jgi:predicted dehydrogenase
MPPRLTRRHFLLSAALAGTGLSRTSAKPPPPSERLRVGFVGFAGKGGDNLKQMAAAGVEVVALCDVDTQRKEVLAGRKKYPKAKFYTDFRKLIDAGGLDALVVSTPDHTHALPTLRALQAGLHVFCEKPLTHTVQEARLVAETAARKERVTQMGTQIHAGANYRRVVELIQAEVIGAVREVHAWVPTTYGGGARPRERPKVPAGLEWDLWLGPAPERPYHGTYVPFYWRKWWDFGGGALNDMACHYVDLPFWALKLRHPTRVSAEGSPKEAHAETAAVSLKVSYDFPARDKLPAVKLTWYDGGGKPPLITEGKVPKWNSGVLFVGSKGMLLADYNNRLLLPEKDFRGFKAPKASIKDSVGHYKEWVEACKGGGATTCNFDYSGALTEAVLLGTVSYRLGKPFDWDAKKLKASEPGADKYLRKTYRKPWTLDKA